MMSEAIRAIMRSYQGHPVVLRRPGSHTWLHGLPFKIRFKRSKIYVSAIPVIGIGLIIGFLGSLMGIGGGFLLVPMLIYFLRVPTATVIGTSTVLTLVTMASATVMHAATNHLVDALLALILMVGGVIGAQFGARAGQNMKAERLRLLLGLLVLGVGVRFAHRHTGTTDRVVLAPLRRRWRMKRIAALILACMALAISPAFAERLITSLSSHQVLVSSSFTGTELVLFGAIERDGATSFRAKAATTSSSPFLARAKHWSCAARIASPASGPTRNPTHSSTHRPISAVLSNKPLDEIAPAGDAAAPRHRHECRSAHACRSRH